MSYESMSHATQRILLIAAAIVSVSCMMARLVMGHETGSDCDHDSRDSGNDDDDASGATGIDSGNTLVHDDESTGLSSFFKAVLNVSEEKHNRCCTITSLCSGTDSCVAAL